MRIEKIVFAAIVMAAILSGCGKIEKAPVSVLPGRSNYGMAVWALEKGYIRQVNTQKLIESSLCNISDI